MKEAQVILNSLLDKFENSKHLSEPNTSRRWVMLRIDKRELPEYQYEDAVVRDAYNIAARELEQQALVRLEWARKQSVLSCIVLDLERVAQCYECADRVHPRKKAEEVANIIMQKLADNPVPWIAAWRNAVCAQVRNSMKVPTYCRENDGLLQELLLTFQRYAELSVHSAASVFTIPSILSEMYGSCFLPLHESTIPNWRRPVQKRNLVSGISLHFWESMPARSFTNSRAIAQSA